MPKIYKKNCDYCKIYYEKQNFKFCSYRCAGLARKGKNAYNWKKPRRCIYCGKLFKSRNKKYCSKQCEIRVRTFLTPIKCKYCGKEFKPMRENTKYCSYQCAGKAKEKKVKKICIICKKQFKTNLYRKDRKYCSQKCYATAQKSFRKGKNNPHWKGGISKRRGRIKSGFFKKGCNNEYKTRKILRKENYYVIRSAGSKGLWDLICYYQGQNSPNKKPLVRCIQIKTNNFPPKQRLPYIQAIVPNIIRKELWIYRDYKKEPEIIIL